MVLSQSCRFAHSYESVPPHNPDVKDTLQIPPPPAATRLWTLLVLVVANFLLDAKLKDRMSTRRLCIHGRCRNGALAATKLTALDYLGCTFARVILQIRQIRTELRVGMNLKRHALRNTWKPNYTKLYPFY